MDMLVSTEWLAGELGAPDLAILDASLHLPSADRDPRAEYEAAHIPGARFLDLAGLHDPASPLPTAGRPTSSSTLSAKKVCTNCCACSSRSRRMASGNCFAWLGPTAHLG